MKKYLDLCGMCAVKFSLKRPLPEFCPQCNFWRKRARMQIFAPTPADRVTQTLALLLVGVVGFVLFYFFFSGGVI